MGIVANSGRPRILLIFGTRPEAIKMAPVYHGLKTHFDTSVCVSAQHREMLDQVLEFFDIPTHHDLDVMTHDQSLTQLTARVLVGVTSYLEETRPDLVFVQGDTTTAYVGALAAFYLHIPVCHVEAGLRTHRMNEPFPEEMNRRQIGALATHHFAPTDRSRVNLLEEAIPAESIFVTGNTAIDALQMALEMPAVRNLDSMFLQGHRGILVTTHRRENFGEGMENVCRAIAEITATHQDVHVVFPVHYNPNVRGIVNAHLANLDRVTLIDPVDYARFVRLMHDACLVISDSGGVQEEAPSLGKPVLVLRDCTERPEAIDAGTVQLVGTDAGTIVGSASKLLNDPSRYEAMARAVNPYGDGRATQRILGYLASRLGIEAPGALAEAFTPLRDSERHDN